MAPVRDYVQCVTCGGSYYTTNADGTDYYHACPPLSVLELKAAIAAATLQLSPATQARYTAAVAADVANPPAPGQVSHVDQLLLTLVVDRPNARNENVMRPANPTDKPQIISAGKGTQSVPPPALATAS